MFHTIADFVQLWQDEAKNTEKLFLELSDGALDKESVPGIRTLRQLAWHIIETPKEILERTGLKLPKLTDKDNAALKVAELVDIHRKMIEFVVHQIQTHWHNKDLHHTDIIYDEEWTRSKTLNELVFHLIHHRGQMTVLMHLAGIKVPSLYGSEIVK